MWKRFFSVYFLYRPTDFETATVGARKSATGITESWATPCANSFRTGSELMDESLLMIFPFLVMGLERL
jgi:hypothetical protein